MKKLLVAGAMLAASVTACKKTGEGQVEVDKPVVGVQKDTVSVPTVDAHMDTHTVVVPKVKMETTTIKTPDVDVKKPQ